ncbi:TraR/DksA C4-type zinc finger protein [Thiothrix lacustris]|uniref:TraR/DksA C4-type zinc finger protein n=1 Tax=Thiothrix lacustris TaxID=525917 RepID=UPI00068728C2|nr:TraR/DksA C4-type zinc finger protein [Thiothrix lacustris]
MDDLDRAQQTEELYRAQALAKALDRTEEPDEDEMGRYCLSCGVMIPAKRVAAVNAVRCIDCQTALEHHNKHHANPRTPHDRQH